jgi:hypothetical protein
MIKEFEETFTWQPKKAASRAGQHVLCSKSLDALSEMLTGDPTLYLSQLKKALWDDYGVKVSIASICRAIHLPVKQGGLGLSLQKLEKRAMQRNMKERMEWIDRMNRGDFDHKNVLVLDECSVGTNASRRVRGYGPVGHRVRHYDLFGKTHNGTLMAACNSDGFVLAACEFINETMDTDRCVKYVEERLVESQVVGNYIRGEPSSIVVMDNVNQHHAERIQALIEGAGGILIFLPRYR